MQDKLSKKFNLTSADCPVFEQIFRYCQVSQGKGMVEEEGAEERTRVEGIVGAAFIHPFLHPYLEAATKYCQEKALSCHWSQRRLSMPH
jgi:hypothetical protein